MDATAQVLHLKYKNAIMSFVFEIVLQKAFCILYVNTVEGVFVQHCQSGRKLRIVLRTGQDRQTFWRKVTSGLRCLHHHHHHFIQLYNRKYFYR